MHFGFPATRTMTTLQRVVREPLQPGTVARGDADYEALRRNHGRLRAEQDTSARLCGDVQGL